MHVSQGFKVIGHRGNAGRGQADDAGHGINLKPAIGVAADDTVGHWCAFWIGGRNSANHGAVSAVFQVVKAVAVRNRSIIYWSDHRRVTVLTG